MATRQDFTIDAGRDYGLTIVLTEDDEVTPLNLFGCTLEWAASRAAGQAALIAKSSADADEIEITSEEDGEATIFLAQTDTEDLGGMVVVHELVVTDVDEAESTVLRGFVTITRSLLS